MKRSEIPSLDDLRAFETTARLGSVRLAAEDLALTHGAVSRRITKLSEDLSFRLFEKSGRGLRLTAAGETLNLTLGRFFAELATTIDNLRAADPLQSALVLSCEPSVAMRWLIPRHANFQGAHPDIALHLSVGGGPVEFRRERIDLAIRPLDFALPEAWHVQRLFAEKMGPIMNPQLAPAFAAGDYIALGSKTRPDAWSHWLSAHPSVRRPTEIRYYDHHFLIVEAAFAGLGVALSPLVLATDDVDRGRLVAPAGSIPTEATTVLFGPETTSWVIMLVPSQDAFMKNVSNPSDSGGAQQLTFLRSPWPARTLPLMRPRMKQSYVSSVAA